MEGTRIVSILNEPWGCATVYTNEPEQLPKMKKEQSECKGFKSLSKLFEETEEDKVIAELEPISETEVLCLSYLLSSMFATILEDTLTELRILVECNSQLGIIKATSDMGLLLKLKYGVEQPEVLDELDGIDPKNIGCNEYKIYKLDDDRKFFIDVLTATYIELSLNRSFKVLGRCVIKIIDRDNYRAVLQEEEAKNKTTRRELKKQLRQQRNHIKSVLYDSDVTIDDLKTQVEDSVLNSECRNRYIDNWQHARSEQHIQTIGNGESIFTENIEYYKQRSDYEQRVHSEVELLVNIAINVRDIFKLIKLTPARNNIETLQKIEDWMNKYDKDMENIDLKIQIKKNDHHNMMEKRINLEETIEKHDELMKDWIHFKEEREKARLYREKMTKSAIIVQAWWRGLLVRRQLGPYKQVKKKRGKKN